MNASNGSAQVYTMPQRMLDAALCAYSISDSGFSPDAKYLDPIGIKGKATTFDDGHGVDAGFVAMTRDKWVVLSFRGTLPTYHNLDTFIEFLEDWLQDDETRPVHWDYRKVSLGRVEAGFLRAMRAVWPGVKKYLDEVDWDKMAGIQITGHSKGASMTFLAAAMIKIRYPQAKQIEVHAYAPALTGDPQFAQWYRDNRLDATTMRYQRLYDIVPFVPPSLSWDIFDHLRGRTLSGYALELALRAFGHLLHGGYETVGSMTFLPGDPPSTSPPMRGAAAEAAARQAIVHAVAFGHAKWIMHAHSGTCSYWPAVFQTPNDDPKCKKVRTDLAADP